MDIIEQLGDVLDHIRMAQDEVLSMRPEDTMTHLNSAEWLLMDLMGYLMESTEE